MQRMRFFFKLSSIKHFIIDAMSGRANLVTKHQVAVILKFRSMCSPTSDPIVAVVMLLDDLLLLESLRLLLVVLMEGLRLLLVNLYSCCFCRRRKGC